MNILDEYMILLTSVSMIIMIIGLIGALIERSKRKAQALKGK